MFSALRGHGMHVAQSWRTFSVHVWLGSLIVTLVISNAQPTVTSIVLGIFSPPAC